MPHTRNAKKRLRQNEKRRSFNRATVKAIKTQVKKLKEVVGSGNMAQATIEYNLLAKKLDKAAARRVVHPNLAARKKSQCAGWLKAKPQAAST
jgi:small subunit ribosomal protein S20